MKGWERADDKRGKKSGNLERGDNTSAGQDMDTGTFMHSVLM
jgi:hypothetical protein